MHNGFESACQHSGTDRPHDPDGEEGSEDGRKYGQAVIAKKVDGDEDFPLNKAAFVKKYGDHPIRLNSERVVSLSDIFEHVEGGEFDDFVELHKAVGKAMHENDFWFYEDAAQFVTGKKV